jgi:hypothetical protein
VTNKHLAKQMDLSAHSMTKDQSVEFAKTATRLTFKYLWIVNDFLAMVRKAV